MFLYFSSAVISVVRARVQVLTEQDTLSFALSQDGFKYPEQWLRQLLLQVVLCVDGNGVLQHVDRVLQQHVEGALSSRWAKEERLNDHLCF